MCPWTREIGHRERCEDTPQHMKMETEDWRIELKPRSAKDAGNHQELGQRQGTDSPSEPQGTRLQVRLGHGCVCGETELSIHFSSGYFSLPPSLHGLLT